MSVLLGESVLTNWQVRESVVSCAHNHFEWHSSGAHHFEAVYIREEDLPGLRDGRQTETLNYVKQTHFNLYTTLRAFRLLRGRTFFLDVFIVACATESPL